jgi:hypothetical protein
MTTYRMNSRMPPILELSGANRPHFNILCNPSELDTSQLQPVKEPFESVLDHSGEIHEAALMKLAYKGAQLQNGPPATCEHLLCRNPFVVLQRHR